MKRLSLSLFVCGLALGALTSGLVAETVTVPAVTSLPVGAAASPFFSDVRVFNTSYSSSVSVTAVYRCFLGACPASAPQVTFVLGPRESRAFDDMVFAAFNAPSSAGAVEFTSPGTSVRVTSRLYSTAPIPTVGMFIPGLRSAAAHRVSVLTSLSNGLFRANVGIYNGNDVGVLATVKLFNGTALLGTQSVPLGPRSGTQINRIFDTVGQGSVVTTNAYAVVEGDNPSAPLFTYAAVIDNATTDPIFVTGAQDEPAPSGPQPTVPPPPTATPTPPATQPPAPTATPTPTRTPTPGSGTTVVELVASQFEWNFSGGGASFTMRVGQTYELRITSDDVTHGFGGSSALGLQGATLNPGSAPVILTISPTSSQIGSHAFTCSIVCGDGHPFDGAIQVSP